MARIDDFTEDELREIVANSSTNKEILLKLGYTASGASGKTLHDRCKKYNILLPSQNGQTRAGKTITLESLAEGSYRTTTVIKRFILRKNLIPYQCSECGQQNSWNNKELVLHLDHINGIGNDHRLENLRFLCPNCHSQTNTYSTNSRTKSEISTLNYCSECKKPISKGGNMCVSCASIARQIVQRPEREAFKKMIRVETFVSIGKRYGLSDNAIRKWCVGYNLPSLKRDIAKISDEEWEKL